ncbi:hypothetical protein [Paraburkholderia sp. SIMBA_030]|uniref:hypothetical protein n=1 Tax=Paraburkholderia sp. SIMBA_030 TaxID=3085773 RepID=UPI00397D24CF
MRPGDIVLADDNGVLLTDAPTVAAVIDMALASDLAKPATLVRLDAKEPVRDVLPCFIPHGIHASNDQH